MKEEYLGQYLLWRGKLGKIVGRHDQMTVTIELIDGMECPHCGKEIPHQFSVIPYTPLWKECAKPLPTISE